VPTWAVIPMVLLATSATIIASQAVITGVFSLTRQAIQMGYVPRLRIVHTSSRHLGQIYVPQVNWLMMIATLSLVIGFQSSSKLAAAYGVAVTATMLITSLLFYVVARERWQWSRLRAGLMVTVFLVVDVSFFSANLSKLFHGAWCPLVLAAVTMLIMMTWKRGREILSGELREMSTPLATLKKRISSEGITRVRGNAVLLTGQSQMVPIALMHNIEHNKVIHSQVALLNFSLVEVPRVPNKDKLHIDDLGSGLYQWTAYFGFMESPSVPQVLALAQGLGLNFRMEDTSFFLGREKLVFNGGRQMGRWRAHLFAFLSRNAYDASLYFGIPEERVMEVGVRLGI